MIIEGSRKRIIRIFFLYGQNLNKSDELYDILIKVLLNGGTFVIFTNRFIFSEMNFVFNSIAKYK